MSITVILAPSLDLANAYIKANGEPEFTVEAEYGASVIPGFFYTAAHHGALGTTFVGRHLDPEGRPAPCNDPGLEVVTGDATVLISHLDLDTFGGCLRLMPEFQDLFADKNTGFWNLAEFVDTRGAHRRLEWAGGVERFEQLDAFWAWSKANSPRVDQKITADMTAAVVAAGEALLDIFASDPVLMAAGRAFRAGEAALNRATFRGVWMEGAATGAENFHIIWREAEGVRDFCNHLYVSPQGVAALAVLSHNEATGAITLSLALPIEGVSCAQIMQSVFGPDAGGHAGIAGTPRGQRFDDRAVLWRTHEALVAAVQAAVKAGAVLP